MNLAKEWFYSFCFLFSLFAESIFHTYLVITRTYAETGMLQQMLMVVFVVAISILLLDIIKGNVSKHSKIILVWLLIISISYLLTGFLYKSAPPAGYRAHFLKFGVLSIPMAIWGIHLNTHRYFDKVVKLLPLFVIPLSLILGTVGLEYARIGEMLVDNEAALNYQNLSYIMAVFFVCSIYYALIADIPHKGVYRYARYAMLALVIYCPAICLLSGGRGAFVFIIFSALLTVYLLWRRKVLYSIHVVVIFLALVFGFLYVFSSFGISEARGFIRIIERLTDSSSRDALYLEAYNAFKDSYGLGNGVGSVWWTVGFYSHNMFMDLLSEIGILGTAFFSIIIYKTFKRLVSIGLRETFYLFVLLIFAKAFVQGMFSGYWLSNSYLWFGIAFIFANKE